jgi:glycosyltransferase involved in cell wall biosynthesis
LIRILVSNTEISEKKIGSWTQRFTRFSYKFPDFITYYLSPTFPKNSKFLFCKKRSLIPFISRIIPFFSNPLFRSGDFINSFKKIYNPSHEIQVLVIDDILLLASFAMLKEKGFKFQLIFSFHGHSFNTSGKWISKVDKVLFLTRLGYLATKDGYDEFTPEVALIGNGVDSKNYFPLSPDEKRVKRAKKGYSSDEVVVTWLSNDRPKKGLFLFLRLIPRLLIKNPKLRFQIIGSDSDYAVDDYRVSFIGRLPNSELPEFLQISDIYCFTSLWREGFGLSLAEAAKCGNVVVASQNGGIPEVIEGLPFAFLVSLPNILESWELQIENAISYSKSYQPDIIELNKFHSLESWENRFLKALEN